MLKNRKENLCILYKKGKINKRTGVRVESGLDILMYEFVCCVSYIHIVSYHTYLRGKYKKNSTILDPPHLRLRVIRADAKGGK